MMVTDIEDHHGNQAGAVVDHHDAQVTTITTTPRLVVRVRVLPLLPSLWTAAYLPSVSTILTMTECGWMLGGAQV